MSGPLLYFVDCTVRCPSADGVHLYLSLTTGYETKTHSQKIR
jgi:hypothetical protein